MVFILFGTTVITFLTGLVIERIREEGKRYLEENKAGLSKENKKKHKEKTKKRSKRILLIGVVLDLGILLFLKYYNFFAGNANTVLKHFGAEIPILHLLLPLGISFYTLQAIAYMVDVYRGKCEPDRNIFKFMLFMSFFPQIVQGPIARYTQLAHQLYAEHKFDYKRLCLGLQLILWGCMKKMIIADRLAIPVDQIFDHYQNYQGFLVFLAAAFYGLQVYADFSGGMDIARGVSQVLGIELELNFKQPYFSVSIEDFWRRWHITLGRWMRDYVFYPLSLSKQFANLSKKSRKLLGSFIGKRLPSFLAMFIVYFLVGFWHGPNWKYIAYGIWNGVFIVSGILLTEFYEKVRNICRIDEESFSWRLFQIIRTFILITIGRFFSRANGFKVAIKMIWRMTKQFFDFTCILDGSLRNLGLDTANWILLFIAIIVLFAVDYLHERNVQIREAIAGQHIVFRWSVYILAILFILVFGIYGPEYSSASFIYEQF